MACPCRWALALWINISLVNVSATRNNEYVAVPMHVASITNKKIIK